MPDAPQPPAAAPATESATTALYRAALGPMNTARYLALFARFDDAGRPSPAWNWAAGLLTLNWLAFRQLWLAALIYVACAEGLALLVLGIGRRLLYWPPAVEWGVLGALLVLCIAIPGAYGNAWLHAETRRRMTRAVREARTVREACAALTQQASTPRRFWTLVVLNVLLLAALAGGYLALSPPSPAAAVPPSVTKPLDVEPPPSPAPEVEPAPAVTSPDMPASSFEPAAEPPEPAREVVPVEPASTAPPRPLPVPPPILAPSPAPALAARSSAQGHGINVGLFADPANAEKAHATLMEAGLPASRQTVDMPKGPRIRVRAGPFSDRAQAEAAAERIRALGLEAQIYAQ